MWHTSARLAGGLRENSPPLTARRHDTVHPRLWVPDHGAASCVHARMVMGDTQRQRPYGNAQFWDVKLHRNCSLVLFLYYKKVSNIQLTIFTLSTPRGGTSVGFTSVVSPCLPSIPRQQHGVTHPRLARHCQPVEVLLP